MTTLLIDLIGGTATVDDLEAAGERMIHAEPAFAEISNVIQDSERRLFDRFGGRYVLSGDTMRSLTQPHADGAIRDIHGDGAGLTFGTSIWYAHFLKKPGTKKSAVLPLTPTIRKRTGKILLDHIRGRML